MNKAGITPFPQASLKPSRSATFCAYLHDFSMEEFNAKQENEQEAIGNPSAWQVGWMLGRLEVLLESLPEEQLDALIEELASARAAAKAKGVDVA